MRGFQLLALLACVATASAGYASPLAALKQPTQLRERPSFERPLVREGLLLAKAKAAPPPKSPLQVVGDGLKAAVASSKSFWMAAVAGGFAGTCMFPVDTAKVRMQACAQAEQAVAANLRTYKNTFQTLGKIAVEEGFPALYKGLLPVILGSAPEMAVQVAAYEAGREFLSDKLKKDRFSFEVQFGAGCISGFTHVAASNPMEVLKIRGQVLGKAGGSLVSSIKEIGFKGLYKGVGACWSRDIPFSAIYFPVYAYTKKSLEAKGYNEFGCAMVAGLVAGVAAAAPTTPCDVVKTRLQNPKVAGVAYKGVRDCITRMAAEEGLGSFFVGVGPRVGRVAPYLALSLTSYELIKAGLAKLEKKMAEGSLFGKPDPKGKGKGKGTGKGKK